MAIRRIEGLLHLASEGRYAILVGRFNSFVVEHLLEGAIDTLKRHGVSEDNILWLMHRCMGTPNCCKKLPASDKFDAIIALGAVIRGSTPHFDFVAGECAKGLGWLHLKAHFLSSMAY
jgi:6,7-dimethyl-8-ribityllumazine synthase